MVKHLSPEQAKRRAERRAREATFPKCRCGATLGLERSRAGITQCRGCLPDETMAQSARMDMLSLDFTNAVSEISDPNVRDALWLLHRMVKGD